MVSKKIRVYVALYFRNNITSNPQLVQQFGTAAYHWAILLESKDGDTAHAFDVKEDDAYPAQGIPGGWAYHDSYDMRQSRSMLCKIMIGKLPPNIDAHGVGSMLNTDNIPLPLYDTDPIQNCVSWVREAIAMLQQNGCAENFDINQFVNYAVEQGAKSYAANPRLNAAVPLNYTNRPM